MAQLPPNLRPKYYIRRRALRHGLFGHSTVWRFIAFVIIFENGLRRVFGRTPERLVRRRIGVGQVLTVAVHAPLTRKQRSATGVTKASLEAAAQADVEAAQRAS